MKRASPRNSRVLSRKRSERSSSKKKPGMRRTPGQRLTGAAPLPTITATSSKLKARGGYATFPAAHPYFAGRPARAIPARSFAAIAAHPGQRLTREIQDHGVAPQPSRLRIRERPRWGGGLRHLPGFAPATPARTACAPCTGARRMRLARAYPPLQRQQPAGKKRPGILRTPGQRLTGAAPILSSLSPVPQLPLLSRPLPFPMQRQKRF